MDPQHRDPWAPPGSPGWVGPVGQPQHAPPPPHDPKRGGGPGWGGTIAAAGLAAILATGGTAAAFTAFDDTPAASTSIGADTGDEAAGERSDPSTGGSPNGPMTVEGVNWNEVAESAAPSVVAIGVRADTGAGQGSGVIIDSSGLVLTNNHVIASAASGGQLRVSLNDGRVFAADIVGLDPSTDLGVLRIQDAPSDLQEIEFGSSDDVLVGQPVMAVGNPLGLSHTITTGIVSALDRPVITQAQGASPVQAGERVVTNAIQTDAAINPGNSGGALLDAEGRLIGINSSIATTGSAAGSIGLGFAIPANQAQWVAEQLVEDGTADHAFLGVTLDGTTVEVDGAQREAARIIDVVPGTPAEENGLSPGDAVLSVDGEPVVGADSLVAQVREREPGTRVTLRVADSGGDVRELQVTFGTRPAS